MKNNFIIDELEKSRILFLHESKKNTVLNEQQTPEVNAPEPWKTATCQAMRKSSFCKDKVLQVQMKLNLKCPANKIGQKLIEDGIYGPKTYTAIKNCTGMDFQKETEPKRETPSTATAIATVKPTQIGQSPTSREVANKPPVSGQPEAIRSSEA